MITGDCQCWAKDSYAGYIKDFQLYGKVYKEHQAQEVQTNDHLVASFINLMEK